MSAPLFEASQLSKHYGSGDRRFPALRNVDLRIEEGAFVAVTGPSGSGKSTLLGLLGLLARPSSGSLQFRGQAVAALDASQLARLRNRDIGFVFQSYQLLERATVQENVELPLLYSRVGSTRRREQALSALRAVGLAERAGQPAHLLSGGEQQRVAIARAVVGRPRVVLADEPTGALDTRTGDSILALLRQLQRQGTGVVIITHNDEVAASIEHRLELRDGALHAADPSLTAPGARP